MNDCIFCKIAKGEIPCQKVFETENILSFKDIHPSAPIHYVLIPKKHYKDALEIPEDIWSELLSAAKEIGKNEKATGFRLATNIGTAAAIGHMHMHYLSGIEKERNI